MIFGRSGTSFEEQASRNRDEINKSDLLMAKQLKRVKGQNTQENSFDQIPVSKKSLRVG